MMIRPLMTLILLSLPLSTTLGDDTGELFDALTPDQATLFAELALKNIDVQYPNKPSNVMAGPDEVLSPREMHPAFYGCFDWHSSVHGHWMLVRILRRFPEHALAERIRTSLHEHLTAENIEAEARYFQLPHNKSFERMYGWAWALRLVTELHDWDDADGRRWRDNLRPLEEVLVQRTLAYLPLLTHPIRTGEHPDTGFALGQALDYARTVGHEQLERIIVERSKAFYLQDRAYPFRYEPSGQDFFSSGLNEADLMRRVLEPRAFARWLDQFLPSDLSGPAFVQPVTVSDVTDGKLVHLAGLNLSRAWCMRGVARALPPDDPRAAALQQLARAHARLGLGYVFSGHYEGEHWLATFAIYAITQ